MTEARRKQVADTLRKVASLLHTRKAPKRGLSKKACYTVDLRAMRKIASER